MPNGAVCYDYRSQNGFGGMNAGQAVLSPTGQFKSDKSAGFTALWNKQCGGKTGEDKTWEIGYAAGFRGMFDNPQRRSGEPANHGKANAHNHHDSRRRARAAPSPEKEFQRNYCGDCLGPDWPRVFQPHSRSRCSFDASFFAGPQVRAADPYAN
jgi:hypothetical protein